MTLSPPLPAPTVNDGLMSDFLTFCDYCGDFTFSRWIFDRQLNEDHVACPSCCKESGWDREPYRDPSIASERQVKQTSPVDWTG